MTVNEKLIIYAGGGSRPNPWDAGIGVIMMYGGRTLEIWEYIGESTNNVAELTAILRALENIKNKSVPTIIYSNSDYAIGVLTGRMKPKKNLELIERIQIEMRKCWELQLLKGQAHIKDVGRLVSLACNTRKSGRELSCSTR